MDDRKKAHHKWVLNMYTSFKEGRIHCPGCLHQQKIGYEWTHRMLTSKSDRTPLEEQELMFDRLKINFLEFLYKKLCKKVAEEQEAALLLRVELIRSPITTAIIEEDLYC